MQKLSDQKAADSRNDSLDMIRVLAIAAVIMIHVSASFVVNSQPGTGAFLWGNLFDTLSRIGVPLFLMLSGALLLNENKPFSLKNHFLHRMRDLIIALIFWSLLYAAVYQAVLPVLRGRPFRVKAFLLSFLDGYSHLWFLYMLIGIYLALPLLRLIATEKNRKLVLYYILISMAVNFFVPIIKAVSLKFGFVSYAVTFLGKFQLGFFHPCITYYLLGWYLVNVTVPAKKDRVLLYFAAAISFAAILLYGIVTRDYDNAYNDNSVLVLLYSTGVFISVSSRKMAIGTRGKQLLRLLSKMSFGIYAVHLLILNFLIKLFRMVGLTRIYAPVCMLALFIITFVLSAAVTFVLSKIPVLKKVVKC